MTLYEHTLSTECAGWLLEQMHHYYKQRGDITKMVHHLKQLPEDNPVRKEIESVRVNHNCFPGIMQNLPEIMIELTQCIRRTIELAMDLMMIQKLMDDTCPEATPKPKEEPVLSYEVKCTLEEESKAWLLDTYFKSRLSEKGKPDDLLSKFEALSEDSPIKTDVDKIEIPENFLKTIASDEQAYDGLFFDLDKNVAMAATSCIAVMRVSKLLLDEEK